MPRFGGPAWKEKEMWKSQVHCYAYITCWLVYYGLLEMYDIHPQECSSLKDRSQLSNSLQSIADAVKEYYLILSTWSTTQWLWRVAPNFERATGKVYSLQPWQFSLQGNIWNNWVTSWEHAEKCPVGYISQNPYLRRERAYNYLLLHWMKQCIQ